MRFLSNAQKLNAVAAAGSSHQRRAKERDPSTCECDCGCGSQAAAPAAFARVSANACALANALTAAHVSRRAPCQALQEGNAHNEPMMSAFHPIATERRTQFCDWRRASELSALPRKADIIEGHRNVG